MSEYVNIVLDWEQANVWKHVVTPEPSGTGKHYT
jgi:hypothetical protein